MILKLHLGCPNIILLSLLFGLCVGIIYLGLTACCSKPIVYLAYVGVFVTLLFIGIYILAKPVHLFTPNTWDILLGIGFILTAIVFLIYMFCYNK